MLRLLRAVARDNKAATAVEYGLIITLIFIAIIVAVTNTANGTIRMWNSISNKVVNA